jgi:hypothetical protein
VLWERGSCIAELAIDDRLAALSFEFMAKVLLDLLLPLLTRRRRVYLQDGNSRSRCSIDLVPVIGHIGLLRLEAALRCTEKSDLCGVVS